MPEKLTYEEHKARAMMLGGWYGKKGHVYYFRDGPEKVKRLCADTLQPLTSREVYERFKARHEANG